MKCLLPCNHHAKQNLEEKVYVLLVIRSICLDTSTRMNGAEYIVHLGKKYKQIGTIQVNV